MSLRKSSPSRKARSKNRANDNRRRNCEDCPESITAAAAQLTNGSVFTGLYHGDALEKAKAAHALHSESYFNRLFAKSLDGFMTSKGRFVDPEEAYKIAVKSRQVTAKSHAQAVEDLWPEVKAERWLCSLSFNNVRSF